MNTLEKYFSQPFEIAKDNIVWECKSSYMAALLDARSLSGRTKDRGYLKDNHTAGSWPAVIIYMILIDHIGSLFKEKSKKYRFHTKYRNTDFLRCIDQFSNITEQDALTLYALRNSFVHSFNLFNKNKSDPTLQHTFTVTDDPFTLIKQPKNPWNGVFTEKQPESANSTTFVSLTRLSDEAENIHKKVFSLAKKNKLEFKESELKKNFLYYRT